MSGINIEAEKNGNEIVIRVPLTAIMQAIESENEGSPDKIVVVNPEHMLDDLCHQINHTGLFAQQIIAQIDELLEADYASVAVSRARPARRDRFKVTNIPPLGG